MKTLLPLLSRAEVFLVTGRSKISRMRGGFQRKLWIDGVFPPAQEVNPVNPLLIPRSCSQEQMVYYLTDQREAKCVHLSCPLSLCSWIENGTSARRLREERSPGISPFQWSPQPGQREGKLSKGLHWREMALSKADWYRVPAPKQFWDLM